MVPKINVYLSDELAEAVKDAGLPVSAICQRALEQAVGRVIAIRETFFTGVAALREGIGSHFTQRAHNLIVNAIDDATTKSSPLETSHLLAAILAEGENLAVRVLTSMEIEPEDLALALAVRMRSDQKAATGPTGGEVEPSVGATAQEALRLAATESTSLGHNYIGSEHLLLGIIAEPDGVGGQVLRAAGAELRLTRRAVVAALAGYRHLRANTVAKAPTVTDPLEALNTAISAQMTPIIQRLESLERRIGE
jgi:ATP-dependent Clp protease ATP-binding subunit ClpA